MRTLVRADLPTRREFLGMAPIAAALVEGVHLSSGSTIMAADEAKVAVTDVSKDSTTIAGEPLNYLPDGQPGDWLRAS